MNGPKQIGSDSQDGDYVGRSRSVARSSTGATVFATGANQGFLGGALNPGPGYVKVYQINYVSLSSDSFNGPGAKKQGPG